MKKAAILGVDFGLSKINSTLTDLDNGNLILDSESRYIWEVQANNWLETDPRQIWEVSQKVVGDVISRYDPDSVEIRALVLSCFGECIVPVDEDGNHLYPIIGSNDIRARKESEEIEKNIPDYSEITGGKVAPSSASSKILWIRNHKPEIFEKTRYFFSLQQYILKKLGVSPINDYTLASRKMLLDIRQYRWSPEVLNYLGIREEQLGEISPSASIAGEIKSYGKVCFKHALPIIIGAHDAGSSALGLGISPFNDGNLIGNNSGTWNLMNLYSNHFSNVTVKAPRLTPGAGPAKGSYYFQTAGAVGPLFDWFVRTFCPEQGLNKVSANAVYDGTCKVRLLKDPMEGNGIISGLSLENDISQIFAGIIESVTFPMKDMLKQFENLTGRKFDAMRISAGGARADNWVQLKANVMNIRMERVENLQASALGAAINAAIGIGYYSDYDQAISRMVRVDKVFEPDPQLSRIYEEKSSEFLAGEISGPCFFM